MRVLSALILASLVVPGLARADLLSLESVRTRETLTVRIPPLGQMKRATWRRVCRLFRSWRTGERRPVHPRLLRTLAKIQRHFRGKRIELISGYRVPTDHERPSSYHGVGRAADIRIVGVPNRTLFDYCRTLPGTGCGYYPNGRHVHVDVRGRSAIWVDLSRPGMPADYVQRPRGWLKTNQ